MKKSKWIRSIESVGNPVWIAPIKTLKPTHSRRMALAEAIRLCRNLRLKPESDLRPLYNCLRAIQTGDLWFFKEAGEQLGITVAMDKGKSCGVFES